MYFCHSESPLRGEESASTILFHLNIHNHVHARGKLMILVRLFCKDDFDWNTLRNLYEVAACIVGWKQCEFCAGTR